MHHFLIRGAVGAAIGYTLPFFILLSFAWIGILGIHPSSETIKTSAMFLFSRPTTIAAIIVGCVVGLASAARHRHLTNRSADAAVGRGT